MTKMFKNYILNIFIVTVFFLSQIINVDANYLKNISQKEEIAHCVMEKNKTSRIIAFDFLNSNHKIKNKDNFEVKIEKVLEPVTIGTFGIGIALGYASGTLGLLLGWFIKKIAMIFKSSR
ncbi:hypothetical protein [Bartonella sp. ML70XJBT.G]|uniref:hypothetical protein n=1 Tax=Bartonella sp. ML70XJBT.G TaxID=3019093 RepID=UPI00235DF534|nr:hypothetical protein [Bartonella sp. ML70XJBT.G]